ncbi:ABC transporter ATP-binding protein [Chondromyces crocatus]|uniref:Multidrug ABC transporter ATPase n=1 Tax=Chondromyces crocatus TaxID=52 RepID=A0A0K1EKE2_CHOCO|nr:ATP-binding cassette domain-containing protein [Chondromyces crocatus]AKT41334.1 multidrug ABC transporter ATPase [Chondromyces crocatus]
MSLRIEGLHKRFGGREVLRGVELGIEPGERVALVGTNGVGKSTLLSVVAGLIEPEAGTVVLHGTSLLGRDAPARAGLGYLPEAAAAPPHLSVRELLALVAALKRAPSLEGAVLDRVGARSTLDLRMGSLSLGQRRRACLAAALVGDPTLLVLDEPTNGLDPAGLTMLIALLRERAAQGAMVLVATHDFSFADAIGARHVRLEEGRVQG